MNRADADHEFIDVGFIHPKLVCKHCDREKGKEGYSKCDVLLREEARSLIIELPNGYWNKVGLC